MEQNTNSKLGLVGIFLVVMGCLFIVFLGTGCYATYHLIINRNILGLSFDLNNLFEADVTPTLKPILTPTRGISRTPGVDKTGTPTKRPATPSSYSPEAAMQTLKTLSQAVIPNNDPRNLAMRYKGLKDIPLTLQTPPKNYKEGDSEEFWVVNGDTDVYRKVKVTLAYATPHVYFWIQEGIQFNRTVIQNVCEKFESSIYPTNRQFFGSEWKPGIDNDPHLYVIYAKDLGSFVAGYFSSNDSVHPLASQYSNGHETFMISASNVSLTDGYMYTVLAHEFQHMIHWYRDRNEATWMNEGFAELATFLNGYGVGGHDFIFARNPDTQLTDWPSDKNKTVAHYGSSFLFVNYFLNRFGSQATQELVASSMNGLESVDEVLLKLGARDNVTGKPITTDDLFVDWTLANYLRDKSVGDSRFYYANYSTVPSFRDTEVIKTCPVEGLSRTVSQYGADYLRISCQGKFTLKFTGAREVGVLPVNAHSGQKAYWSNQGDESDMTLTQSFDLTNLKGAVSLNYWTWYDLEENYDYVHVGVSEDGKSWKIIKTPSGTDEDLSGNSFGWGYNGQSGKWIEEKVDLSAYAGKKIQVRFNYITDAAVNGEGLLLDDISIPQLGYQTDFEKDDGGWQAAGFVRIENRLPQTYRLSLIKDGKNRSVEYLTVNPDQTVSVPLDLTGDVILVVSGSTRFTRQPAVYEINIQP